MIKDFFCVIGAEILVQKKSVFTFELQLFCASPSGIGAFRACQNGEAPFLLDVPFYSACWPVDGSCASINKKQAAKCHFFRQYNKISLNIITHYYLFFS